MKKVNTYIVHSARSGRAGAFVKQAQIVNLPPLVHFVQPRKTAAHRCGLALASPKARLQGADLRWPSSILKRPAAGGRRKNQAFKNKAKFGQQKEYYG